MTTVADTQFLRILHDRELETVFQPITHVASGATVGYEALVRGPAGSRFASATSLLDGAYRTGRVTELDWAARASACRTALARGLDKDMLLFLNVEPLALNSECPPDLWPVIEQGFQVLQIVLEVTERSLDRDPRSLLDGIDRQRPMVAALAMDDVGSETTPLSMMSVLGADVIKLDMAVTQAGPTPDAMKVLDIAYEEAERTGATILAEGVETVAHVEYARSFGATLAQGRYYGPPGALPAGEEPLGPKVHLRSESVPDPGTPFDALPAGLVGRASESLLVPLSHQVAYHAVELHEPALVIVLVPRLDLFGPIDRYQMTHLAQRGVVIGALGAGMPPQPAAGIRGADVSAPELAGQWAALALSSSTAGAMLAQAIPGSETEYRYGVTHNRTSVIAAARRLLRCLGPND